MIRPSNLTPITGTLALIAAALHLNAYAQVTASSGSGFFVAPTTVVTNEHVVQGCAGIKVVQSGPAGAVAARISRTSTVLDLAVLELYKPIATAVPAPLRPQAQLGEEILVAGHPLAGLLSSDLVVTTGVVYALTGVRDASNVMQISAQVQIGNSGGPVLDRSGAVVGVVVAKLNAPRVASVTGDLPQNVNFAIKPEIVGRFLDDAGVRYTVSNGGPRLEAVDLAARARTHTVKVLCLEGPTGDYEALRDSMSTALSAAVSGSAPPVPSFADTQGRLEYLKWLDSMSGQIASAMPELRERRDFLQTVWYEGRRAGIDPTLLLAMVERLSGLRRTYVNAAGSRGYMAVAPKWTMVIGNGDEDMLFHVQTNLRYGCVLLRHYIDVNRGDLHKALVAYAAMSENVPQQSPRAKRFPTHVFATHKKLADK